MNLSRDDFARCVSAAHRLTKPASVPVDVAGIVESLGFQVIKLIEVPQEFSGIVSPQHRLIGVNGNHHRHRQRFTLAHELGHVVLNHPPERRCTAARIAFLNREADTFASEILMPIPVLQSLLQKIKHPAPLSRLFDVSVEAMERKIREFHRYLSAVDHGMRVVEP